MNDVVERTRGGYPLSALFLLLATCAAISALLSPLARSISSGVATAGAGEVIGAGLATTLFLMVLGAVIGLHHYRRLRGVLWGVLTGAALGVLLGPLALAPVRALPAIYATSLVGALVLVGMGIAVRSWRKDGETTKSA
jgi:hypothetical protein